MCPLGANWLRKSKFDDFKFRAYGFLFISAYGTQLATSRTWQTNDQPTNQPTTKDVTTPLIAVFSLTVASEAHRHIALWENEIFLITSSSTHAHIFKQADVNRICPLWKIYTKNCQIGMILGVKPQF